MNTTWERPIHACFESLTDAEEATQPSLELPARSTTPGLVENSFSGGFTPIHQPQQRGPEVRQAMEPIRYGLEESVATTRYVPTTRDMLDTYDKVKRDRERRLMDEIPPGSSRTSPRPETSSTALGERNRGDSPLRGQIITSVAASDFTAMKDEIAQAMATTFERQVGRLPTGTTVTDCVVGIAFTSLHTRLRTDRDQDFVDPSNLDSWRTII